MPPRHLLALVFVSLFAMPLLTAADQGGTLFLLSGQSNMVKMEPKTTLEPEAAKLFTDGPVRVVKVAENAQPIRRWLADYVDIAAKAGVKGVVADPSFGTLYTTLLDNAKAEIAKARPSAVVFCWMQGEADATTGSSKGGPASMYETCLKLLIERLRHDLDRPDMVVVIGRLSDHDAGKSAWDLIRDVQVRVAKADAHGAWVDTDDCNSSNQGLHYSKVGYELLGQRFARQAALLLHGGKPAEDGKP